MHAKFGTSGAATPEALPQDAIPVVEVIQTSEQITPLANGDANVTTDSHGAPAHNNTQVDEDGFVIAKNSRGRYSDARLEFRGGERGRGRGGFRGDRGGEHRGGTSYISHIPYITWVHHSIITIKDIAEEGLVNRSVVLGEVGTENSGEGAEGTEVVVETSEVVVVGTISEAVVEANEVPVSVFNHFYVLAYIVFEGYRGGRGGFDGNADQNERSVSS